MPNTPYNPYQVPMTEETQDMTPMLPVPWMDHMMPDNPFGPMQDLVQNQTDIDISDETIQELFPELYPELKPHIEHIAQLLQSQELTDSQIDAIVEEILKNSSLSNNTEPMQEPMETTIATQTNPWGRYTPYPYPNPYHRRRRYSRYYYDLSLQDLVRLMLVHELWRY